MSLDRVRSLLHEEIRFAVLGLRHPWLSPMRLIDARGADSLSEIALGFGDSEGTTGRYALVISAAEHRELPSLAELLEGERYRVGEPIRLPASGAHVGGVGAQVDARRYLEPVEVDGLILVDDVPTPARLRREGRFWAAHIAVSSTAVYSLVARGIEPSTVHLGQISDLRSLAREWLDEDPRPMAQPTISAEDSVRPPAVIPNASNSSTHLAHASQASNAGLDAHVHLVRSWLAQGGQPADAREMWATAVAHQMHYASQSEPEAVEAVTAMLNQALRLAERAAWFSDDDLAVPAVHEMARYTVFDSDVASRRAQEWWNRVWMLSTGPAPQDEVSARSRAQEFLATESVWLFAWNQWAQAEPRLRRQD